MAFSMFLRNTGCTSRMFLQQAMRVATQAPYHRPSQVLPISTIALKEFSKINSTPVINSVRSFHSSPENFAVKSGPVGEKPHDHSKLWVIEKGVAALMVPLIPLGLLLPNRLFDSILAILICAHSFWGLEAIAIDYVRASVVGPILPKIALALVYLLSIATLGGLFYIISHDVGLANTIKQIWAIKSQKS